MPGETKTSSRAEIATAAQQFEALFASMMLKAARQASIGDGLFDSEASRNYRDMQDSQIAQELGRKGTLGIARAMTDFLSRAQGEGTAASVDGSAAAKSAGSKDAA